MKEFKCLRVLFMSEDQMEREMAAWCSNSSDAGVALACRGEEGAEPEGKGLDLQVHPHSNPQPWSRALSGRAAEMSFLCRVFGLSE